MMNTTAGNIVRKEFSTLQHSTKQRALYAAKGQLKNRPSDLHSLDQWISKDSVAQSWNPLSLAKFCKSFRFCKVHIPLFLWIHLAVCVMRITDRSLRWCISLLSERLKGLQSGDVRTVLMEQSSKERKTPLEWKLEEKWHWKGQLGRKQKAQESRGVFLAWSCEDTNQSKGSRSSTSGSAISQCQPPFAWIIFLAKHSFHLMV